MKLFLKKRLIHYKTAYKENFKGSLTFLHIFVFFQWTMMKYLILLILLLIATPALPQDTFSIDHLNLNKVNDSLQKLRDQYKLNPSGTSKSIIKSIMIMDHSLIVYYCRKRYYMNAIDHAYDLLMFAEQSKNTWYQLMALKLIGGINFTISRYPQAEENYNQCVKLFNTLKDTSTYIDIYIGYANIAVVNHDPKKASYYFYYSLYLSLKSHNLRQEGILHKQIGNFFLSQNKLILALNQYQKSLAIAQKRNALEEVAVIYTLIAHIYQIQSRFDKAVQYNLMALALRKDLPQEDLYAGSFLNLGHSYAAWKKYDSALCYLDSGIKKILFLKNYHLSSYGYHTYYEIYLQKKDYKKALYYFQLSELMKDSLAFEKSQISANIQEANQKLMINERESSALKAENQIQKTNLHLRNIQVTLALVVLFFLILVLSFVIYIFDKNRKAKKLQEKINESMNIEIKKRLALEKSLRINEAKYRFITENSPDVISREDGRLNKNFVSPSSVSIFGYTPDELTSLENFLDIIHPLSIPSVINGIEEICKTRVNNKLVYRVRKKDDSYFWAESLIHPIFDDSTGELAEMISVTRDITDRIEQQEELEESARHKEFLIREVNHRVKNNMSILMSMVRIQRINLQDEKVNDLLNDLQFRIKTMALVHDQLHISRNIDELSIGVYLSNLVNAILKAFNDDHVEIHTFFFDEMVHVDVLLPLGLIINEIITNSFKYAFPENAAGHIWVLYEKDEQGNDPDLRRIIIKDDGIGLPENFDFFNQSSMGSQMIAQLTNQLGGELVIDGSNGTSFTITLQVRSGNKNH